ncbi:hypothetical protein [Paraburkholderia sp. BCC1886]|uniref:hypothetical protein n=1 Tax=Paraburkholderia sp. BCC1886 TaxID=2562670 RepID=UPI0011836861|nr:hypothetical protein [Paraburkholderia sp. BCC1886]
MEITGNDLVCAVAALAITIILFVEVETHGLRQHRAKYGVRVVEKKVARLKFWSLAFFLAFTLGIAKLAIHLGLQL